MITGTDSDIVRIIEESLEMDTGTLDLETMAEEVEAWDSLGHLNILANLDKHFDGRIAGLREIASADSIPKILAVLKHAALL